MDEDDVIVNQSRLKAFGRKPWAGTDKWVSRVDLYYALGYTPEGEELLDCLHSLGIDVTGHPVVEQTIWHRPITAGNNQPVLAVRWIGLERTDKEWLTLGMASIEVRASMSKFTDLRDVVRVMGKESNHTGELITHMKGKKDAPKTEIKNEDIGN